MTNPTKLFTAVLLICCTLVFINGCNNPKNNYKIVNTGVFNQYLETKPNNNNYFPVNNNEIPTLVKNGTIENGVRQIGIIKDGFAIFDNNPCNEDTIILKPELDGFILNTKVNLDCNNKIIGINDDDFSQIVLLQFANNYINAIEFNNPTIKKDTVEIVKYCEPGDKYCETAMIVDYISNKIRYTSDARDSEHIQNTTETMELEAGDCEDISIAIASYLENIGIKTKFVILSNHAYVLACGLPPHNRVIFEEGGYVVDDDCYPIDGTLGKNALIGFIGGADAGIGTEQLLVDPVTKKYEHISLDGMTINKISSSDNCEYDESSFSVDYFGPNHQGNYILKKSTELRKAPIQRSCNIIGTIPKNTTIGVTTGETKGSFGEDPFIWVEVNYQQMTGWIRGDYLDDKFLAN